MITTHDAMELQLISFSFGLIYSLEFEEVDHLLFLSKYFQSNL